MTGTGSVLDEIVAATRAHVARRRREQPLEQWLAGVASTRQTRAFGAALERSDRVNVIAEFKRRSPSKGLLRSDLEPALLAEAYAGGGAAALSVLTEPDYFGGALADLMEARRATTLPTLRKDFIVDPYQVWESRAIGADAFLLIVAALHDRELEALLGVGREVGLETLVEVHDAEELRRALDAGAHIIGVNNRDLRTLRVSLQTSLELAPLLPEDVVAVAESGLTSGDDIRRLREVGYDAFLVGEHLMRAHNPGAALGTLLREAAAP